ncbi:MAG: hypothetical protein HQL45_07495 [Alphaproteobacteria bacterium]|nr:hypothetical protein [Alphaproteobacteria bacterium]
MPNLAKVQQDPKELKASIDRMLGDKYARHVVRSNHGLKTPEELQGVICATPYEADSDDERSKSLGELLDSL